MNTSASAVVNGRGARRARRGHPWIYADDVVGAEGHPGAIVQVLDRSGAFCCWAAYSPRSRIVLRRVSPHPAPPDGAFWSGLLDQAIRRRGAAAPAGPGCARILHADADGFPGLTVDRYGEHLVCQATTVWADLQGAELCGELARRVGAGTILARNDSTGRALEGLPRTVTQWLGRTPEEVQVEEAGLPRFADLWRGHKTGLYLDQQENHRRAPSWLSGRVLDLFSAEGGFALPLARAGAQVVAADQSEALLARARRSADLAGAAERIEFRADNVFDMLAGWERAGEVFDGVIVDPPPFARRRHEVGGAVRGYKDLHRRALRVLRPGGRLLSFSCSFAVDEALFEAAAREGAEEAGISMRVLARPGAAPDHPERLDLPESRYLKGLLLERSED